MKRQMRKKLFFVAALLLWILLSGILSTTVVHAETEITLTAIKELDGVQFFWDISSIEEESVSYGEIKDLTGNEVAYLDSWTLIDQTGFFLDRQEIEYGQEQQYYLEVYYSIEENEDDEDETYSNLSVTSNLTEPIRYWISTPSITKSSIENSILSVMFAQSTDADTYLITIYDDATGKEKTSIELEDYEYDMYMSEDGVKFYDLSQGKKYTIEVIAQYSEDSQNENSTKKSVIFPLDTIKNLKVTNLGETSNKITWAKNEYAEGYQIYRSTSKKGTYTKIKTITNNGTVSYTDTNKKFSLGTTYYYQVKAYTSVTTAKSSSIVSAKVTLAKVTGVKISQKSATSMVLSWTPNSKATGYIIYRAVLDDDNLYDTVTYKKYKTQKSTSCTIAVQNGKYYSYKIVPYKTINGKALSGNVAIKNKWADYYGYKNEDWDSRWKRIFGSGSRYTTQKRAAANMTKITVKVWDFANTSKMSGKKITKKITFSVNKKIAPTLKKAFEEIYNGKEKAPIYSIGGYSWRGNSSNSEHNQGLAIDINPAYNYSVIYTDYTKTKIKYIESGKLWNPKKYAYSIKKGGDIETILAKYGFSQGIWSTKNDYMHFSYFGN